MTKTARKALQQSLNDWIELWEWTRLAKNRDELLAAWNWKSSGAGKCALCKKFFNEGSCFGCPIFQSTGRENCLTTPFYKVSSLMCKLEFQFPFEDTRLECLEAIEEEIEFLASLQENDEPHGEDG